MHRIKFNIIYILLAFLISCITPFEPEIKPSEINKYVVSGLVSDYSELQSVSITMASSIGSPAKIPVTGCSVLIRDDRGNLFQMQESGGGLYQRFIDRSYLVPGVSFKVEIVTGSGIKIESDYEKMNECPDVDSVYYLRRDIISNNPGEVTQGIQFFLNVDGKSTDNHFFRWELTETWEYHVPYPREWYYDGTVHHIFPPDYSRKVCWSTIPVNGIFTLSTLGLTENKYEMLPLHFIDNLTSRLMYGYILLVKQFSMSEAAYSYWDQLRINSGGQGGLYEKQPLSITGNLHNLTDPENAVLGFFGASSVRSKRIFIHKVEGLNIKYVPVCTPSVLRKGLIEIRPEDYPSFLFGDEHGYAEVVLGTECVDCFYLGGNNIKPDFWPW